MKPYMKNGFMRGIEFAIEQLERQKEIFESENMTHECLKIDSLINDLEVVIDKANKFIETINESL